MKALLTRILCWCMIGLTVATAEFATRSATRPFNNNLSSASGQRHGEVDLGTTLVAIRYDGGVVVGADTRTSVSSYVSHRFSRKIDRVSSSCVLLRSGSAADTQQLASDCFQFVKSRLFRYGDNTELSVSQIAHWLRMQIRQEKRELMVSLIIAGYDHVEKCGKIYSLFPSAAICEESTFAVSGSGSSYIIGYLDQEMANLKDKLPNQEQAIALCRKAVRSAIHRDGSSGGMVRMCILASDGIKEHTILPEAGTTSPSVSAA